MKYNDKTFYKEVNGYIEKLKGKVENKVTLIILDIKNKKAFYSLAPLSRAIHELNGDIHVVVKGSKNHNLEVLKDVWYVYRDLVKKLKTRKVEALLRFIRSVNKRVGNRRFKEIFKKPDIVLIAEKEHFSGTIDLKYKYKWHRRYRWNELLGTAKRIWRDGYALKKGEKVSIGFVLMPAKKNMELPLEDYLDSYSIALAMGTAAKKFKAKVSLGTSTCRFSQLAKAVRTADLMATLRGCELDKEVDEEVFKRFKEFSKLLKIDRLEASDAAFGIHGKGYFGKHFFGENIGYPSLDKKTRWSSPGQLMLKDPYSPQTRFESRDPMMRYAITETLPIDIFIETCNIDYNKLRKKSDKVRNIFNKCEWIRVVGKQVDGYKTDFKVGLVKEDGERKYFISSDCDVRSKVDQEYFKRTGIKAGSYANFPSGEAFVTPTRVEGTMVGDVVINIDQSYVIPPGKPIVVGFDRKKGYKIIKAPAKIREEMKKQLDEGREKIRNYEEHKSLPKEVIEIYKKNFRKVGEFAVNTNPKAKLCDYLIVNEKIAKMIHVALGLGFEPERKTVYHWDIVVNSPKQKLDIYGIDKKHKIHWVIKKGNLVV
ncbi:hypothetical protein KY360_00820 [Candidatus Woesearchaeota archaeon]|nr:hypothetical protein [Candidatus Woesearchaeota archaeon]